MVWLSFGGFGGFGGLVSCQDKATIQVCREKDAPNTHVFVEMGASGYKRTKFGDRVILISLFYIGYFVAALVALLWLLMYPKSDDMLSYAYWVVVITSAAHFGFMMFGFLSMRNYEPHPVWPKVLFLFSDYLMAAAVGGTIVGGEMDAKNRTVAILGNAIVLITQIVCAWKTAALLIGLSNGTRDENDGFLISKRVVTDA